MKTIIINVTKKDIELGKRGDCGKCPVARAARRKLGDKCNVSQHYMWFERNQKTGKSPFPPIYFPVFVEQFIRTFDLTFTQKDLLKPFKFTIKVPE